MRNITIIRICALASTLTLILTAFLAVASAYNDVGISVAAYFWLHLIFLLLALPLMILSMRTMPFPKFLDTYFYAAIVLSFVGLLITSFKTNLVFAIILMLLQAVTMYFLIQDQAQRKKFMEILTG